MTNIKFALMGEKGSGKTFISDSLEQNIPFAQQFAFADPLKTLVEFMFDWIPEEYTTPENKEKPIPHPLNVNKLSYREILVEVGAIANRIEPGIFIRKNNENVEWFIQENPETLAFITDVRTEQEVKFCKDNGIPIIKVVSPQKFHSTQQGSTFENFVKDFKDADAEFQNTIGTTTQEDIVAFFKKYF